MTGNTVNIDILFRLIFQNLTIIYYNIIFAFIKIELNQ